MVKFENIKTTKDLFKESPIRKNKKKTPKLKHFPL